MTAVLGGLPVHPRIRARRVAIERDRGRKRVRWLVVGAALLAVVGGVVIFLQSSWVDVDEVEVLGAERTGTDAVLEAAGITPGSSLLTLDLGPVRAAVAALPWVDEVRAEADLSGRVRLEISERQAVAQVQTPAGYSLVDSEGRVVSFSVDPHPDLAVIAGTAGAGAGGWVPTAALEAIAVGAAMDSGLRSAISAVTIDESAALWLELNSGGRVQLGDSRDLEHKLIAVETVIDQVELDCLAVIDVRAATAPVVTRAC